LSDFLLCGSTHDMGVLTRIGIDG